MIISEHSLIIINISLYWYSSDNHLNYTMPTLSIIIFNAYNNF